MVMVDAIKLGLMAPLSGIVELYGPEISWAARIACDEINDNGGVLGRPLQLVIEDDGSLPESAVPAALKLVNQHHCAAIIGNLLSNSRIAVANRVAEPFKVPMLNFSFSEGSISGRYFFHFAALPNQQIDKMIPYMIDHFGPKVFFAGNNYEWPRGSIDAAKKALLKHGGEVVGETYFDIGTDNFEALLDEVKNSGADFFVPYAAGSDQLNLLTQFTDSGLKERMAVVMGHYDEAMVQLLPPKVRAGFYSSNSYFMSLQTPANTRYLQRLAQHPQVNNIWPHGNGVLTNFGEGTYLCVHAFAKAANLIGSVDAQALVSALEHTVINGPQGTVKMDPVTHHAHINTYLARCRANGTFEIIESFGQNSPETPSRYQHLFQVSDLKSGHPPAMADNAPHTATETTHEIFDRADIAIIAINEHGSITHANRSACQLFAYPKEELHGLNINLLLPPHLRHNHMQHIKQFMTSAESARPMGQRGEIVGYRKDGSFFPAESTISKFQGPDGIVMITTLRDISVRKQEEETLRWDATHDPLTKLPNRTLIIDRVENALIRTQRSGNVVALLFIDVDEFKLVNDNHGHNIGDRLLVDLSKRLLKVIRPGDTVARFGGDEFLILCDQINSTDTLPLLADRILQVIKHPITLGTQQFFPTASIGIAVGNNKSSSDQLLRNADAAMYQVKAEGRDGWKMFNEEIRSYNEQQLYINNGLRHAIEKEELDCYFQPIVEVDTLKIIGAEALMRWCHQGEYISPAIFIPIAESSGIVTQLGAWIFAESCRQQVAWRALLGETLAPYVSINLSARQLTCASLVDDFLQIIEETTINPHDIVLEITETTLMSNVEIATKMLQRFGDHGIRLAIDDFGTGHSSLSRITHLPVEIIKVDQAFIRDIDNNNSNRTITSAVIDMAHRLQLKVTAEGVEGLEQLQILGNIDCNNVQGYYFSRPIPASDFITLLKENNGSYSRSLIEKL